jgi:hypothetical protein
MARTYCRINHDEISMIDRCQIAIALCIPAETPIRDINIGQRRDRVGQLRGLGPIQNGDDRPLARQPSRGRYATTMPPQAQDDRSLSA